MRSRQTVLIFLAIGSVGAYAFKAANQETIADASNRLGEALLASDTDTLWSFVPEDERSFYQNDRKKFDRLWNELVAPKLKEYDSFRFESDDSSGLIVVLKSSHSNMRESTAGFTVSGQLGKYYVPFSAISYCLAAAGTNPGETRKEEYVPYEHYVAWFDKNKQHLEEIGFGKIRRGPSSLNGLTIDQLRSYYQGGYEFKKTVLK